MRVKINPRSRFWPTPACFALRDQLQHTLLNAALKAVVVNETPACRDVLVLERLLCRRCEISQTITLWFGDAEGHWRRCPAGIRFNPFSPFDSHWLRWWLQGERNAIATCVNASATFAQLVDWLCDVLAAFIRCKQSRLGGRSIVAFLNEQTVECLGLNEPFWQRYRVRGQTSNRHDADEQFVHELWRARACLEQVEKENKGLTTFVLHAIVGGYVEPSENVLRDLKRFFLHVDTTWRVGNKVVLADTPFEGRDAMWRLLCQNASELYAELQMATEFKWGEPYFWAGVIAQCDCYVRAQACPPLWARDVLMRRHISLGEGDRRQMRTDFIVCIPLADHLLRTWVARVMRAHNGAEQSVLHHELALVARWWQDKQPVLDREQRRGGWSWLVKQAMHWQRIRELTENSTKPINCPLPIYSQQSLTARALLTKLDVELEGEWMRNCVGQFWSDIEAGTYLVYRINDTTHPCVTLGLKREEYNQWSVHDVRFRFNRQASQTFRDLAQALAVQLTSLTEQGAFPLPSPTTNSIQSESFDVNDERSVEDMIESYLFALRAKG